MKVLTKKDFPLQQKTAVAIGLFDGIHAGHMRLMDDIKAQAGLQPAIFTFDSKPAADRLILTPAEKQSVLAKEGMTYYYIQHFDRMFSQMPPEGFVESLQKDFNMAHLTVGFDFRFGKDAAGDTQSLLEMADALGFSLRVIPEIQIDGMKVSSSLVRQYIKDGDMAEAARLMEHFYFADGRIEPGNRIGNRIGFPTANISTDKLLPLYGVYATIVQMESKCCRGVTNVGVKPTIAGKHAPNIETYILDFEGDIYGDELRVYFVELLRPEVKFDSIGELQKQIAKDSGNAVDILADLEVYKPYLL